MLAFVIAIDGEAGSGKSTLARAISQDLNWPYLSTGLMYRAATLVALQSGLGPEHAAGLAERISKSAIVAEGDSITLSGVDVTSELRSAEVNGAVSHFAALPEVRESLLGLQRVWVDAKSVTSDGVVVEGRDIGTVVCPSAQLKLYLTADAKVRGERRPEEGTSSLLARDVRDSERELSPLVAAEDAVVLDTTNRDVSELLAEVRSMIDERMGTPVATESTSEKVEVAVPDAKPTRYEIREAKRWELFMYSVVRTVVALINRTYFGLRLKREADLPTGPFVLAPIHRSNIDTMIVASITRRRLRYMGKEAVFKFPLLGDFLVALGGIPLNRDSADRDAVRRSVEALQTGEPLVIFPEGQRRSGDLVKDLHEGAAYLALRAGVPVVPVGIAGTERIWRKGGKFPIPGRSFMISGPPIYPKQSTRQSSSSGRAKAVPRRAVSEMTAELNAELQRLYELATEELKNRTK